MPRVNLPFQVIERVNESRASREAAKERGMTLFDVWEGDEGDTFEEGWRNKLIWGDNLLVMSSLLEQDTRGDRPDLHRPSIRNWSRLLIQSPSARRARALQGAVAYRREGVPRYVGRGNGSYLEMMEPRLALHARAPLRTGLVVPSLRPSGQSVMFALSAMRSSARIVPERDHLASSDTTG